ncbi:MAG: DUF2189 domain-containing protein [Candidatus Thiodiazotropha taylori]|nr:DUF2189 domain-containing protein [Candidatus Thiodiazotropha taylori]MCW4327759.1 DUF2189 domain-containing protein [Candidatus Thiodiazotropha taylori]
MSTPTAEMQFTQTATDRLEVNKVESGAALQWLSSGFEDFKRTPALSLLYGLLFASLTAGVFLLVTNAPWYAVAYLTGLVVMGPFMASGLYAASRDMQQGREATIDNSLRLLIKRSTNLALFATLLALVMAAWVRISALLFAVKFSTLTPSIEAYTSLFSSAEGWITMSYFVGIGFLLVTSVFVISAVAIPAILDKDVDFITAMQTSYRAVTHNPGAMASWAVIIVALTAVGVMTAFVGFAVLFPILGYATWHSYRSLVK